MPTRLMNLKIRAVATVDHPDNPDADILLFKRDNRATVGVADKGGNMPDEKTLEQIQEDLTAAEKARDDAVQKAEDLEGKVTDLETKVTELEAKVPVEVEPVEVDPDIQKRLDESKVEVEKARQDAEDAKAEVAKMRDAQDTEDAEQAVAKLDKIPGLTVEFAPVLKRLRQANKEDADAVEKALSDANKVVAESALLAENGKDGQGAGGDIVEKVKAEARQLVAKSTEPLSFIQAEARVWKAHPDWNTEYNKQREG